MNRNTIIFFSCVATFFTQTTLTEEPPQAPAPQPPNTEKGNDTITQVFHAITTLKTIMEGGKWVHNNLLRSYTPEEKARQAVKDLQDCLKKNLNSKKIDPRGFPSECEDHLFAFGFAREALDGVPPNEIPTMRSMIDEFQRHRLFFNSN